MTESVIDEKINYLIARTRWICSEHAGSSKAAKRKKERMAVSRRLRLRGVIPRPCCRSSRKAAINGASSCSNDAPFKPPWRLGNNSTGLRCTDQKRRKSWWVACGRGTRRSRLPSARGAYFWWHCGCSRARVPRQCHPPAAAILRRDAAPCCRG